MRTEAGAVAGRYNVAKDWTMKMMTIVKTGKMGLAMDCKETRVEKKRTGIVAVGKVEERVVRNVMGTTDIV